MHLSLLYHLSLRSKIDIKYNREIFYLPALIQWENKKNGTHPLKASYFIPSNLLTPTPPSSRHPGRGCGRGWLYYSQYWWLLQVSPWFPQSQWVYIRIPCLASLYVSDVSETWLGLAWLFNSPNDPRSLILDVFNRRSSLPHLFTV